jgi:hypothetical protein
MRIYDWFGIKMKAERLRIRLKADWLWTKLGNAWLGIKLAECVRIKLDVGWLPVKVDADLSKTGTNLDAC